MKTFLEFLQESEQITATPSIEMCITNLLNSVTQIHVFHLITKDANLHPRLGDLYAAVEDGVDAIAEAAIGSSLTAFNNEVNYTLRMNANPVEVAKFIIELNDIVTSHIGAFKDIPDYATIVDNLTDIQEAIKAYLYFAQQK